MHQELRFLDLFPDLSKQAERYKVHLAIGGREKTDHLQSFPEASLKSGKSIRITRTS